MPPVFIIRELQNAQSIREGATIVAPTLAAAKRRATQMQVFQGTTLTIERDGLTRTIKDPGKRWRDI